MEACFAGSGIVCCVAWAISMPGGFPAQGSLFCRTYLAPLAVPLPKETPPATGGKRPVASAGCHNSPGVVPVNMAACPAGHAQLAATGVQQELVHHVVQPRGLRSAGCRRQSASLTTSLSAAASANPHFPKLKSSSEVCRSP